MLACDFGCDVITIIAHIQLNTTKIFFKFKDFSVGQISLCSTFSCSGLIERRNKSNSSHIVGLLGHIQANVFRGSGTVAHFLFVVFLVFLGGSLPFFIGEMRTTDQTNKHFI